MSRRSCAEWSRIWSAQVDEGDLGFDAGATGILRAEGPRQQGWGRANPGHCARELREVRKGPESDQLTGVAGEFGVALHVSDPVLSDQVV